MSALTRRIALGRRKTDTCETANACAGVAEGTSRALVADLLGAPVAELDLGRVIEVSCSRAENMRAAAVYGGQAFLAAMELGRGVRA